MSSDNTIHEDLFIFHKKSTCNLLKYTVEVPNSVNMLIVFYSRYNFK
jgi:hypothetical protein